MEANVWLLLRSSTYCPSGWHSANVLFNMMGSLNYSLYIFVLFQLSCFSLFYCPSLSLSFVSPALSLFSLASPLISLCLHLIAWLSRRPRPLLHLSLLCLCLSLSLNLTLPTLLLLHISLPRPFYLSIPRLNSWFKDCFSRPSTSGGRGQRFTGAWMSFSAVCLWSKALSSVKTHPSIIRNLSQSLGNGHCGYSA